ncbi:MAG: 4-hydroxy-tetrahydrodipicolinate reductase [Prevotellaceae bacterium]|jgi:4-hydroxy-tetrahydrodipicolinate reductase|nr:4-hydroxy-tetrahydrodipicolinate reductase [Prevotellaceae bacterium]
MKIAIIGYGKMGKKIEEIARERGHQIVSIIDINNFNDIFSEKFASADVALEFTIPQMAEKNIRAAWQQNVRIVSGTTSWNEQLDILKNELQNNDNTLFWAPNFSLGVNIFFEINKKLAKIINSFRQYEVSITEIHHTQKKDAPSGTAISLANLILENIERKTIWTLSPEEDENSIEIQAIRQGEVAGTHIVEYDSLQDTITLTHEAKGRDGFALGAVLAAEFVQNKKGFFTMEDLLKF